MLLARLLRLIYLKRLSETQVSTIESAFQEFTERKDIAILLINQHVCRVSVLIRLLPLTNGLTLSQVAEKIRPTVDKYTQAFPALLEIPSKDHPYGDNLHCI
jgi:V-type H+-transporting ATPase subunit F